MELLQLKYFQALAQSEHVTETADRLHVTQSSLSKTIQRLEQDVGAPLFDRIGRGLRLNGLGRIFLERTRRALLELEEGKREIAGLISPETGSVSLAVTTASALPGLLQRFKRERPAARFHVRMVGDDELRGILEQGSADFCFTSEPMELPEVEHEVLLADPVVLAVPRNHPLAVRTAVTFAELRDEEFIGLRSGFRKRDEIDAVCRRQGFVPRYVYEGDEPARINSLVEAGLGVAFVPGTSRTKGDGVRYLSLEQPVVTKELLLLWNRGRYHSPAARQFREFVRVYFRESAWLPS
jgi:DNA-binding transcriptional LysR family regulator